VNEINLAVFDLFGTLIPGCNFNEFRPELDVFFLENNIESVIFTSTSKEKCYDKLINLLQKENMTNKFSAYFFKESMNGSIKNLDKVAQQLNMKTSQLVMIGDSIGDLLAATIYKTKAIIVPTQGNFNFSKLGNIKETFNGYEIMDYRKEIIKGYSFKNFEW